MGASILGIGQSAITAAQLGLATAGHNIANASTPGFNRQVLVQGEAPSNGGVGGGTRIMAINRNYNEFLDTQVQTAETSKSSLETYHTEIGHIDNMLADPSSGLAPAVQDFFKAIQDLSAGPNSVASRQSVLSSADALTARFQGIDERLTEMSSGINSQITTSIGVINRYADQIAKLNDSIALIGANTNRPPNDLLDQRDQLITELSREAKVSVVKQADSTYTVSIGNGQPLVVNGTTFPLATAYDANDLSRVQVGFTAANKTVVINESVLAGGKLGGLLEYRSKTLDYAKNSMGLIALGLAQTFNDQHKLGQDDNGAMGGDFFLTAAPVISPSENNNVNTAAVIAATVIDVSLLSASDYKLQSTSGNGTFSLTRLSDGAVLSNSDFAGAQAAANAEGFDITMTSGTFSTGDNMVIRPVRDAASGFGVVITDKAKIAAAAPILTSATTPNAGTGKITAGSIDATYTAATVTPPVTMTYDDVTNPGTPVLNGFPAGYPVTVTNNGVATVYPGDPVDFTAGATISFGGASFVISGVPKNGDTFTLGPNTSGLGDNRNAVLLGKLQNTNTLLGEAPGKPTASYQGTYAQFVSSIGNKTRELQVTATSGTTLLAQARAAQQEQAGVNLDEEAANLLRYQQAYQAAGKVMQVANAMFDTLLSIAGR